MRKIFAALMLAVLSASMCFALTDEEYLRMKKTNADFARADRRLSQVWKKLKGSVSKAVFTELQDYQREWIDSGRDIEAQGLMDEGYSRVEAYTMATSDRADALPSLAKDIARNLRENR